jgi:hypothetical protein
MAAIELLVLSAANFSILSEKQRLAESKQGEKLFIEWIVTCDDGYSLSGKSDYILGCIQFIQYFLYYL